MTLNNFNVIGKKNNQTLVSDADPEIPTSDQRIMPELEKNSFPALSVYPRVGISLSASETDVKFYLSYRPSEILNGMF